MNQAESYEHTMTANREEVAAILHDVADGIRAGAVRVGGDADAETVKMPDDLELEIELEREGDERSLELELEWSVADGGSDASAAEEGDETGDVSPVETSRDDGERGDGSSDETTLDGEGLEGAPVGSTFGSRPLARFEVYEDTAGEFRWRLRHRNGNVIATAGEGYTRKHNAVKGIRSVIAGSADASITGEFGE